MTVSGNPTDGWTLSGGPIQITDWVDPTTVYMDGTLAGGDLVPVDIHATAYTAFRTDIVVASVNNTIGSPALDDIDSARKLDLWMPFTRIGKAKDAPSSFEEMLELDSGVFEGMGKLTKKSGEAGSMTVIPAPGALVLGSVGVVFGSVGANLASWLRRRRRP
jgi:hypothetical protein